MCMYGGGVLVPVFFWWCGGVLVLVFLGWCLVVVFLWWCSCCCVCVLVFTPILLCTTKYYSSTTPYYRALLRPLKGCQNDVLPVLFRTTPVLEKLPKRAFRARLPQLFKEQASKTSISCDASSSNFHRTRFQNERFARCFRQFSQKKLPKGSFRARLPPNFTEEASKTSVSCEASFKFHRTMLPKRAFRTMLPTVFKKTTSKMIVSCEASSKFHRTMLPKQSFRAMLPTIFTKNLRFATVSRNRHTDSCEKVHPPKAKCASHYNAVHSQMWQCAFRLSAVRKNVWIYPPWTDPLRAHKNVRFYYRQFWAIDTTFLPRGFTASKWNLRFATVLGDRHHVFTERVHPQKMQSAFRYSFGRSTPRFYREGSPAENEICVSLQFWAIDTTFVARGLTARKWNLRFATVLGNRRRVFSERVAFRLTLPIPPGGIE